MVSTSCNPTSQLVFMYDVDQAVVNAMERGSMHEWTHIEFKAIGGWHGLSVKGAKAELMRRGDDMMHGVQKLHAHHIHQSLDGAASCPPDRLDFLSFGTNHNMLMYSGRCTRTARRFSRTISNSWNMASTHSNATRDIELITFAGEAAHSFGAGCTERGQKGDKVMPCNVPEFDFSWLC